MMRHHCHVADTMAIHRKFIRWRMILLKIITRYPITLCILLVILLLVTYSYISTTLTQFSQHGQELQGISFISQEWARLYKKSHRTKTAKECEIFSLFLDSERINLKTVQVSDCQRIQPEPSSCDLAKEIFFSSPKAACSHQETVNFCELRMSGLGRWEVSCNETKNKACSSPLSVGMVDERTGHLIWKESGTPQQTSEKLTDFIQTSDLSAASKQYGFCFIRCEAGHPVLGGDGEDFLASDYDKEQKMYLEQLLVLPAQIPVSRMKQISENNVNINLILVDSVSHQHFFRSLPETVSVLREIGSFSGSGPTVLDFQLLQAVRSRTYETLRTIFSGDIDPSEKPFGTQEIPPLPLNLSVLLKKFKNRGYHTLLIEDLCYLWEWGISKDLHFLNKSSSHEETWTRMWEKLSENFVDTVDITLAMCRVLAANNVADHFHGPDAVCFNGRHQHEYLLEYLQLYQKAMESRRQLFFTFTMTNVAHEDSGRRVQTLDQSLREYIKFASSLQNTLTILFSDHGNSYGRFMHATQEARVELFHPFMIFIVPENVAWRLGVKAMHSLDINTFRLVSFLDLHHTLNYIIDPGSKSGPVKAQFRVSRKGLFEPIAANRTCDEVPRIMPNICICQDYEAPTANDTESIIFAYFALGRLNDKIQRQLLSSQMNIPALRVNDVISFRKCEKLSLVSVQNVRKSVGQGGTQTLKMDLLVQQSQVFFVAVTIKYNAEGQGDHMTELEMYDRITPYGMFSVCADDIDLSLCICNTSKPSIDSFLLFEIPQEEDFRNMYLLPHFETLVQGINSVDGCILLVTVKHAKGAVIFSANTCKNKSFIITAQLQADDKIIYFIPSKIPAVLPGGMAVLALLYTETSDDWTCSMKISCQVVSDFSELRLRSG